MSRSMTHSNTKPLASCSACANVRSGISIETQQFQAINYHWIICGYRVRFVIATHTVGRRYKLEGAVIEYNNRRRRCIFHTRNTRSTFAIMQCSRRRRKWADWIGIGNDPLINAMRDIQIALGRVTARVCSPWIVAETPTVDCMHNSYVAAVVY